MRTFFEIVGITARQMLGRRRTLLLILLAALPPLLALIYRAANQDDMHAFTAEVFDGISLTVVLPLGAVLFGSGAFGAELDEGTILYLLAKPVPRWLIVLAKASAAAGLALAMSVLSVVATGLIFLTAISSDGLAATEAYVAAMVVGSLCYVAVFVALSLFTRRALAIGIAYSLIWEGALSSLLPGIANLSIRQYSLGLADWFFQLHAERARLSPDTALLLGVVVVVVALVIAVWKLQRFELAGGTD